MYYTPAIAIPGKLAHLHYEDAYTFAKRTSTYIMDNEFKIIEDYRSNVRSQ